MIDKVKITKTLILLVTCCLTISTQAQSLATEVLGEKEEISQAEIIRIEVSGHTVFSTSEIEAIISGYPDPLQDFNDLQEIARRLTDLYIDNGYITSGAFLPQQRITNGIAKITIVEGSLENIVIKGRKNLQEKLILSYFPDSNSPLNINNLEQQLKKLERNASIEKVNGELVRGTRASSSVLMLEIEEFPSFQTALIFNNHRSPSIGEYQGIVASSYSNLIGTGDRLFGQYNLTEGFDAYSLGFSLPLNSLGGQFDFEYRKGDSRIIEDRFREANIRAETDTISLSYQQVLADSNRRRITFSSGFRRRKEQTFLLEDFPFSFTNGAEEGRSATSVVSFTGEWFEKGSTSFLSLRSQVDFGLDLFDATVNEDAPDGIFTIWRGDLEWVKALNQESGLLFVFRLASQLTPDSLLPSEKLPIGGQRTVRGFRQNDELGGNGVVGTVEMYIPLYKSIQNGVEPRYV